PRIPMISNVTGKLANDLHTPEYWVRQVRAAVRFLDGMRELHQEGVTAYLECGPEAVLCGMGGACLPEGARSVFVPSLRKGRPPTYTLRRGLGALYVAGQRLDFSTLVHGELAPLPTYAFQRERHWIDSRHPQPLDLDRSWPWKHLPGRHLPVPDGEHFFHLSVGVPHQP